ncbi:MAG: hypothetical protein ACI9SE_004133, partial [Neolewinella sp.]
LKTSPLKRSLPMATLLQLPPLMVRRPSND